jgi:hypothetical protein
LLFDTLFKFSGRIILIENCAFKAGSSKQGLKQHKQIQIHHLKSCNTVDLSILKRERALP